MKNIGREKMKGLLSFLQKGYTPFHVVEEACKLLEDAGFEQLYEQEKFCVREGGKYYVVRGGTSLVAFTVGNLDSFRFKIVAAHTDSPALKLKQQPVEKKCGALTLQTEPYGGGLWHTFFDRPLKIAGRIVVEQDGKIKSVPYLSPFHVVIPSLAIHLNRDANTSLSINAQTDLQPLFSVDEHAKFLSPDVLSHDLYLVADQAPFTFGEKGGFIGAPRIDNLTSVYAALQGLIGCAPTDGVCVAALFDGEEIGSRIYQGADGDFLENVLRRLSTALNFDEEEYHQALAASFAISLDNAHAAHPNHPEKTDPVNKAVLGGGLTVKRHANRAYATDGESAAILQAIFDKAGVRYQTFHNRSDLKSGGTLGGIMLSHVSVRCADLGIAQLAMHSACECFAKADYEQAENGITAFFSTNLLFDDDGVRLD